MTKQTALDKCFEAMDLYKMDKYGRTDVNWYGIPYPNKEQLEFCKKIESMPSTMPDWENV